MKTKRLTKIIAVILVLSMLPIGLLGCGSGPLGAVSERFVEMMVGDGKVDSDYKYTEEYIKRIDSEVAYIEKYYEDGGISWNDKYLSEGTTAIGERYHNCYTLALAWATKGSDYYHDGSVLDMIEDTLENMYLTSYGESQKLSGDEFLSAKEKCDQAEYLIRTLLILDDAGKLSDTEIENYASVVSAKFPIPSGKGVDLIRTTYIVAAYAALLDDETKLALITKDWLPKVFVEAANGAEGIYADGSFIADVNVASTGSYGVMAFSCAVELVYAISGDSDYPINKDLKVADFLYNWAVNSIVPSLYNGKAFTATVSSFLKDAESLGGRAVSAIIALSDYLEENGQAGKAKELRSIVKGYAKTTTDFVTYLSTYGVGRFEDINDDDDIKAKVLTGAYTFAANDKITLRGPKFSAALSLSSVRVAKYETRGDRLNDGIDKAIGGEFWYTGDGMLTIYTDKYSPDRNYWNYVNGKRIPGTTVDNGVRASTDSGGYPAIKTAAGAAVLGEYIAASYDFLNNMNDLQSNLVGKKSYFVFDGEIVAIGAGITNSHMNDNNREQKIETVIENIFYKDFKSVTVGSDLSSDSSKWTMIDNKEVESQYNAIYVSTYGGIFVPGADKSPYNVNSTFKCALRVTAGGNFVEMWLDHNDPDATLVDKSGKEYVRTDPVIENKTYEYCIVPGTVLDSKQFFEYVAAPGYTVLANNTSVQAVKDASSGAIGFAFWEAGAEVAGYKADFACNMMVVEKDGKVTISVADIRQSATHSNGAEFITLPFNVASVVSASAGVTAQGNMLKIDRAIAATGTSLVIELTK